MKILSNNFQLMFYVMFLNYDTDTFDEVIWDALVGIASWTTLAGTPDTIQFKIYDETTTTWTNDWHGSESGTLESPDTSCDSTYTVNSPAENTLTDCT